MIVKPLYRFTREDGGTTVSPNKPECEYTELVRLIADDGKVLTQDGENIFCVIDVDSADGWYEIDEPEEESDNY